MSRSCCDPDGPRPPALVRRALGAARWAAPSITLALMPKCPACFAGYIALWTGVGLSFTAAYYLRIALIMICGLSLAVLAAAHVRRRWESHVHP